MIFRIPVNTYKKQKQEGDHQPLQHGLSFICPVKKKAGKFLISCKEEKEYRSCQESHRLFSHRQKIFSTEKLISELIIHQICQKCPHDGIDRFGKDHGMHLKHLCKSRRIEIPGSCHIAHIKNRT